MGDGGGGHQTLLLWNHRDEAQQPTVNSTMWLKVFFTFVFGLSGCRPASGEEVKNWLSFFT